MSFDDMQGLLDEHEQQIAQRDARIAELEVDNKRLNRPFAKMRAQLEKEWLEVRAMQHALKAQQPSAGVVVGALVSALEGIVHDERVPNEVSQDYAALLIEARRLNPCRVQGVPDGWVDIAERLPEIGQHCLIKIPVCGRHEIEGATYEGDEVWAAAWCSSRGRDCTYKVSHWMAAPSAKEESNQ